MTKDRDDKDDANDKNVYYNRTCDDNKYTITGGFVNKHNKDTDSELYEVDCWYCHPNECNNMVNKDDKELKLTPGSASGAGVITITSLLFPLALLTAKATF